jgi:hypothetical protein
LPVKLRKVAHRSYIIEFRRSGERLS